MSDNNSLVNLGDLSKPLTILIERISEAIGGVFKPFQTVRNAKAEAQAAIIKTQTAIDCSDLTRRAAERFFNEEVKKQENMEKIIGKSVEIMDPNLNPDQLNTDWIINFFDKCRLISDDEMQILWAKILAGEANSPGSYSKRTVNFLSSLSSDEAHNFTLLCKTIWLIDGNSPIIFNIDDDIYKNAGINFPVLSDLDAIGLVQLNFFNEYVIKNIKANFHVSYHGKTITYDFANSKNKELKIGKVIFSPIGKELQKICSASPIDGFFEYTVEKWREKGTCFIDL